MRTTAILILAILGALAYTSPQADEFDNVGLEVWHKAHTSCREHLRNGTFDKILEREPKQAGPVYLYCMKHHYGKAGEHLEVELRKDEVKM